jgi:hypothetical protein
MAKAFKLYDSAIAEFFNGTQDWDTDSHYAVLLDAAYIPLASHSTYADISANVVTDVDYSPEVMSGETVSTAAGITTCDANDVSFGAAVTITAKYLAIVVGTASPTAGGDRLVGWMDLATGTGSVSSSGTNFLISWSVNGVFRVGSEVANVNFTTFGLDEDMYYNQNARFLWRADDFMTSGSVYGPVDEDEYPLPWHFKVGMLMDGSDAGFDCVMPGVSGSLDWDATNGGPAFDSTASGGMYDNALYWPESRGDFKFIHETGLFTILMRVVFHSNPNVNTHYLLGNAPRQTIFDEKHGSTDGTNGPFAFSLNYDTEIRPNTVTVHYSKSGPTAATLTDDGAGNLTGTNATGTINYLTGAISFTSSDGTENGSPIGVDYQESRGFELATDGIGGGLSFVVDGGWNAKCQVSTALDSSTAIEHDIAVVCDGTTLSLFYGSQGTADDTTPFVGVTGSSSADLFLGSLAIPNGGGVPLSWLGDFTLRGMQILEYAANQAEREKWFSWIGGTDFSSEISKIDQAFNAVDEPHDRPMIDENAQYGNFRVSSTTIWTGVDPVDIAAPTELP